MVTTRSSSRLSEEPTSVLPKRSAPTKSKAGRKRKTKEPTSESTKGEAENPTKHAKKAYVEDEPNGEGKDDLKRTTLDRGLKREPWEDEEEGIGKGIEQGAKETSYKSLSDEEQLQHESKCSIPVSPTRQRNVESSPILEKGLVYFFFRPKVSVEHAEGIDDVQRSYIVLRPLPLGAKLKDGMAGGGEGTYRLLVLPKKRLPGSGYERFLTFVEEPKISAADLKNRFMKGSTYMTKTRGERTNPPMEPIGEGVYALTKTKEERSTHLAYILTVPSTPDELQKDFGLKSRGSFIVSVRNPETPAPPQAGIPNPAEYPKEIMEEFRGLRWGALGPKHLDYKHAEVLFIGGSGSDVLKKGEHKGTSEELEKLEGEDEVRTRHLEGDEVVFSDLELDRKEFGGVGSTW